MPARLLLLAFLLAGSARAQPTSRAGGQEAERPLVVRRVAFEGADAFSKELLRLRVRTSPNRRFLNVPGVTPWLWVYRLGASGRLGERLSNALVAGGEAPAVLDASVLAADVERLELLYRQEGFRDADVTARVDTLAGGGADVTFEVEPGPATFIRTVRYEGLDALTEDQRRRLARGSLLQGGADDEDPLVLRPSDERFSEPLLLEERRRLLTFLRNEGFASVGRDSIRAIVYAPRPDSFDLAFRIRPGPRYRFGDVGFAVEGTQPAPLRTDTLARVPPPAGGLVVAAVDNEPTLHTTVLRRALQFRPGDWYAEEDVLATKRRLDATGVFAFTSIEAAGTDTAATGVPQRGLRVEARTLRRHRLRAETFMLQRSGVVFVGTSGEELAAGIGLTYNNLNLFGGGERFEVGVTGSLGTDFPEITSAQGELRTALSVPYLVGPFRGLDRRLRLYDARTRFAFNLLTARRDELRLIIRGRGALQASLELRHSPTVTSFVDLLDLTVSNPDTLRGFSRFLPDLLGPVTDPVQRAQLVEDYTRPQINSAFRYTIRAATANPLRRDRGYSYEASAEVGNNLMRLLDGLAFTPDTLEGSLPGLPFFQGDRATDSRLLYRQYARLVVDVRQYRPRGLRTVFAWKAIAGLAHPTGRSALVPFDRRFYAGGASSVRGWELRALGPGGLAPSDTAATGADGANLLGGDVKLEAAAEWRQTFLRGLFEANWVGVVFVDAGNVWFGPRHPGDDAGRFYFGDALQEFGVGTGFGLRLAWEYLILRLDLAYKLHDPLRPGAVFPDGFGRPQRLHFGIGHAF